MNLYVWEVCHCSIAWLNPLSGVAIAQAESVEEARKAILDQQEDKVRWGEILADEPEIHQGSVALTYTE